ncbi:hypothetical protein MJH12_14005 [bacterium]|nr:hypothetical protein [bacterium]
MIPKNSALNSVIVSEKFENFALIYLSILSLFILAMGVFSNEYFPDILEMTKRFLNWQVVDMKRLSTSPLHFYYQWINRLEGSAWVVFSILSMRRYLKHKKNAIEPIYAFIFLIFGVSDYVEALMYPGWLGLLKFYTVGILLYCRSYLMRHHYKEAIVY